MTRLLVKTVAVTLCIVAKLIAASVVSAQQRTAADWYEQALQESQPALQIQALEKAIVLQPDFVEALVGLGQGYLRLENYEQARKYLMKAYTANLGRTDDDMKSQILYNLAVTYRHLGDMKASEDALRGARNLAGSEKLKSRIACELGEILYQRQQFETALAELSRCHEVEPERQAFYDRLITATTTAVEMDKVYRRAQDAELNGRHKKAIALYEKIDLAMPGFRDVQQRIDSLRAIVGTQPQSSPATITPDMAEPSQQPLSQPPSVTHEFDKKEVVGEKTEKTNGRTLAAPDVDLAAQNGQQGNSATARRNAADAQRASQESQSASAIKSTPDSNGDSPSARTSPVRLLKLQKPAARSPRSDGYRILLPREAAPEDSARRAAATSTHHVSSKSYHTTVVERPAVAQESKNRVVIITGFILTVVVLPVVGLIVVSPGVRARFYLLLGQRRRAIPIYESLLLKHPDMLWLYPALAKLYYRENRQDEQAMHVYKMIQHLAIKNKYADNLNANIVNRYLSNVDTIPVHIEIIDQDSGKHSEA